MVTLGSQVDMAEKIKSMGPLVLKRKVGAGNKIFGTITNKQIIEAVQKATNDGGDAHACPPRCCVPYDLSPRTTLSSELCAFSPLCFMSAEAVYFLVQCAVKLTIKMKMDVPTVEV